MNKIATSLFSLTLISAASAMDYQISLENNARWENNIFRDSQEVDDFHNTLTANLELLKVNSFISMQSNLFGDMNRYLDLTDENSEGFGGDILFSTPDLDEENTYTTSLSAGYSRSNYPDPDLGRIIEIDTTFVGFAFAYQLLPNYGFNLEADYRNNELNQATTRDLTSTSLQLGGFYNYSEKLQFDLGYKYQQDDVDGTDSTSSDTHTVFLGVTGDILSQTSGTIKVGGTYRDFDSGSLDSNESIFADFSLNWQGYELWEVTFNLNNAFETTTNNQSKLVTSVLLGIIATPTEKMSWGASVFASTSDYEATSASLTEDRTDDEYGFSTNLDYVLTENVTVSLDSTISTRSSDIDVYDYDLISLGINLIYTF